MSVSIQVDDDDEESPLRGAPTTTTTMKIDHIRCCVGTLLGVIMIIGLVDLAVGWIFMQRWGVNGLLAWVIPVVVAFIAMMVCFGLFATGAICCCCAGEQSIL